MHIILFCKKFFVPIGKEILRMVSNSAKDNVQKSIENFKFKNNIKYHRKMNEVLSNYIYNTT